MENTATRATQHDDPAQPQHVHTWGPIQHTTPPSYLVTHHGPAAIAAMDWRFRACQHRGCDGLVFGPEVEHQDVLAHVSADSRGALDEPATARRLIAAGATS